MTSVALDACNRLRRAFRPGHARLRLGAAFWAVVAGVSLAAFRLSQVRLQPDAIATGVPGLLYRLIVVPLEFGSSIVATAPAAVALQAVTLMTIYYVYEFRSPARQRPMGEGGGARNCAPQ